MKGHINNSYDTNVTHYSETLSIQGFQRHSTIEWEQIILDDSSKDILKELLRNIKNIAIVGASPNPERDSFKVMKFLLDQGYKIFPVNPKEANILGSKCYQSLTSIDERIDMVDIFRAKEFVFDLTKEAIEINANIIWMQEGIIDEKSSSLAMSCGIKVVMDKCPKKVLES